jgi:long-chain acyl-CoA synthetase
VNAVSPFSLPFLPTAPDHPAPDDAPALCDDAGGPWVTYGALRRAILAAALSLAQKDRGLVLCCVPRSVDGALAYLSAVHSGHAIAMADPAAPNLPKLVDTYEPEWIITAPSLNIDGYKKVDWPLSSLALLRRKGPTREALHADFFLMLLTSGSTGGGKGVRLSYRNMASNAHAIVKSLDLTAKETALGHLPLSYSFGLSVLHMQLAVGGRCFLTEESMMAGDFWRGARERDVTLFAGVPYHYEMLMRLSLARLNLPTLQTFLQAGGKMQDPLAQQVLAAVTARPQGRLFVMYGQTEAGPRISCFPLHQYPDKLGSAGRALDGGRLSVEDGEIVYEGPNVMMGPATCRADLALGDVMGGRLVTGDLGRVDDDGFLYITGRRQRFAKLFGQRIALDEVEGIASAFAPCVAVEKPEKLVVAIVSDDPALPARIKEAVAAQSKIPAPWIDVVVLPALPYKANGKVDYARAQSMVE